MRNIKLVIAFDGTCYSGWQRQKNAITIQGVLEDSISLMTSEQISLCGAGRTDAGVHALGMTANFHTNVGIPCNGFLKGLNSILPSDIRVIEVVQVADDFHSRFDAKGKTYIYKFINSQLLLPTERLYNAHFPTKYPLDIAAMAFCLSMLVGEHDFTSFEAAGSRDKKIVTGRGAIRRINFASFLPSDKDSHYSIEINGNGFLRHMVRNIVGTVIDVGIGRISGSDFKYILAGRDRTLASPTAPSNGLFLKEVFY